MEDNVEGIVLQSIRYGDNGLVVKVYTKNHGLRSYMVKGAFNRNARNRAALFQNLQLIHYVEVGKPNKGSLGYMKDVALASVYRSLPFVMNKSAIVLYVSELLSKAIAGQEQNDALYGFLVRSLQWLDLVEEGYANFPLYFTLELTRHLGFYPKANYEKGFHFDLMEGAFVSEVPLHPYALQAETAAVLSGLLNAGIEEACRIPLKAGQRRDCLEGLILFVRLHAPIMKDFHSLEVLKAVLH